MAERGWRLPYRWVGKNRRRTVTADVADRTHLPREVAARVVIFAFHDDGVVDRPAHELAVLLGQVAVWLEANDTVTVLGLLWETCERTVVYLSVEEPD